MERIIISNHPSLHFKLKVFSSGLEGGRESGPYFLKWQDYEQQETQVPVWKLMGVLEPFHVWAGRVLGISCFNFSLVAQSLHTKETKQSWCKIRLSDMLSSLVGQNVPRTEFCCRNRTGSVVCTETADDSLFSYLKAFCDEISLLMLIRSSFEFIIYVAWLLLLSKKIIFFLLELILVQKIRLMETIMNRRG